MFFIDNLLSIQYYQFLSYKHMINDVEAMGLVWASRLGPVGVLARSGSAGTGARWGWVRRAQRRCWRRTEPRLRLAEERKMYDHN